jgi:hypothetical protein
VAHAAPAGTLVVMGRDWFRWANLTTSAARILCLFSPAGFEQFFADVHEAMRAQGYDMSRFGLTLAELRAAYGDEEQAPLKR